MCTDGLDDAIYYFLGQTRTTGERMYIYTALFCRFIFVPLARAGRWWRRTSSERRATSLHLHCRATTKRTWHFYLPFASSFYTRSAFSGFESRRGNKVDVGDRMLPKCRTRDDVISLELSFWVLVLDYNTQYTDFYNLVDSKPQVKVYIISRIFIILPYTNDTKGQFILDGCIMMKFRNWDCRLPNIVFYYSIH